MRSPLSARVLAPGDPGLDDLPGVSAQIGSSGQSSPSRIPLDDVPVTRQPTGNTCVPTSLDMLLEHHAPGRSKTVIDLESSYRLYPDGLMAAGSMDLISSNLEAIGMRFVRSDLPQAVRSGQPFIAFVAEGSRKGHAVLVQGVREVGGTRYLIVRTRPATHTWKGMQTLTHVW